MFGRMFCTIKGSTHVDIVGGDSARGWGYLKKRFMFVLSNIDWDCLKKVRDIVDSWRPRSWEQRRSYVIERMCNKDRWMLALLL